MKSARGFTIIEIMVVMIIMTILVVLGISSYTSSQAHARDAERKGDAESIAEALERFYANGPPGYTRGQYPTAEVAMRSNFLTSILPGLDSASATYSFLSSDPPGSHFRVDTTTGNAENPTAITNVGNSSTDKKITYQPLAIDNATGSWVVCREPAECRRFKLFYGVEKGSSPQMIESLKQ